MNEEEVKKVLNPECYDRGQKGYPCPIPDWGGCIACEEKAKEICRLFEPKPDEGVESKVTEQELRKKALASMNNCYLEVGTHVKNVVSRQAIPPALREKIYDQILALIKENCVKGTKHVSMPVKSNILLVKGRG